MVDPFSRMYWCDYPRNSFSHFPLRSSPAVKAVPVKIQHQPSYDRASTVKRIPVNVEQNPSPHNAPTVKTEIPADAPLSKSNVVSIPIRFFGSKTSGSNCQTKSEAVITVQKAWRRYKVRKTVKKIAGIKREVDEVDKKIRERETLELVKRDKKERLKVNETLMALLLKLDSVRAFDEGVRNCRKAVIRQAILLQERIDQIAADQFEECVDTTKRTTDVAPLEEDISNEIAEDADVSLITEAPINEQKGGALEGNLDIEPPKDATKRESKSVEGQIVQPVESDIYSDDPCAHPKHNVEINPSESQKVEENLTGQGRDDQKGGYKEPAIEEFDDGRGQDGREPLSPASKQEVTRNNELLEKMAAGNERMMVLVTELFERNKIQTQMLSNLTQRVAMLEKAWAPMRNKKRRKKNTER